MRDFQATLHISSGVVRYRLARNSLFRIETGTNATSQQRSRGLPKSFLANPSQRRFQRFRIFSDVAFCVTHSHLPEA